MKLTAIEEHRIRLWSSIMYRIYYETSDYCPAEDYSHCLRVLEGLSPTFGSFFSGDSVSNEEWLLPIGPFGLKLNKRVWMEVQPSEKCGRCLQVLAGLLHVQLLEELKNRRNKIYKLNIQHKNWFRIHSMAFLLDKSLAYCC